MKTLKHCDQQKGVQGQIYIKMAEFVTFKNSKTACHRGVACVLTCSIHVLDVTRVDQKVIRLVLQLRSENP